MTLHQANSRTDLSVPRDEVIARSEGQHRQLFRGRFVLMKRASRCILCKCDERTYIEEALFYGYTPSWIIRHLPETSRLLLASDGTRAEDNTILKRFESHAKNGHSNIEIESGRAIQEHFAKEAGLDLAGISVVNAMGVLHEFMLDGYRARKDGVTAPPDVAETTKIATAILQFQAKAGPSHARVFQDAIVAIMEELQQLLDPATLAWVIRSLEARPEVQAAIKADAETQQERRALAG